MREKKEKKAAYRSLIRPELADELYDKILNIIVVQKKSKDPDYSAKDLAKELKTNTRYLSAVVNSRSVSYTHFRVHETILLLEVILMRGRVHETECRMNGGMVHQLVGTEIYFAIFVSSKVVLFWDYIKLKFNMQPIFVLFILLPFL